MDFEESVVSIHDEPPEVIKMEEEEDKAPVRWFASRWFLLACIAFVLVASVAGFLSWKILSKKDASGAAGAKVTDPALSQENKNIEIVSDFLIPLRIDTGNQRLLKCDIAFELNPGQESIFKENIVGVRNSIYQTVSKKTASVPLGPGGMKLLRGEIMADLTSILGKDIIKAVYFKSFIVL
ncbi:MAG: flagellar basal body-associated FliL family protein [Syntrophales bacterium]